MIALSYSSLVIVLNFTCSSLICARILYVSKRMKSTLGHEALQTYNGIVSLIIESMLPYTLFGIVYVVTLGINHPTSIFWLSVYVMMTVRRFFHLRFAPADVERPWLFSAFSSASPRK